ncbi:ABC transporter permease [Paractinoplanes deccanensis]|uniref:ABC transporter permease n=2 Tax=Paractinoplanes deccanensis TaxID=113561 RepID=A0ABQ3YI30_9ACTN|nr:ABC transporter permease [Actinoplanes deccanensis]
MVAGALLSATLGVALVQSSLLLLITAALLDPPAGASAAERLEFTDGTTAAVSMLGVVLGGAVFLAGFIISSTFAFTVDQRRRDLALLRLVGGSRGQLRRLLLGEALLLGTLGAALGVPSGLAVMSFQAWLMREFAFVPPGFEGRWRMWILGVSFGTGILLAVAGVLVAARRAARVRPLEALRETGAAAKVMTWSRALIGLVFLGGALALVIVAPAGGPAGGMAMAMNVPIPAAVAVVAFAPLLVPLIARLVPFTGPAGLARANLRDARRRSASVAAPLIVLVALVVGNTGAGASFTASGVRELAAQTHADLVVESTAAAPGGTAPSGTDAASPSGTAGAASIAQVPGVASVSTETRLPAEVTTGSGEDRETEVVSLLVIDPAAYGKAHGTGDALASLSGRAVAAGPGGDVPTKGTVELRLPTRDLGRIPVTASVPATMSGGANLLVPPGLVTPQELAGAPARSFVTLSPGADAAAVRATLAKIGTVSTVADWLRADAEAANSTNQKIMLIVLGLGGLYALIGVINSVVIGAATRRREFAEARVTGMTRAQVVRSALLESYAVTTAALLLGAVAAGATFIAVLATTKSVTGTATLDLPWPQIAGVALIALAVTGATTLITSLSATRPQPVTQLRSS